MSDEHAIALLEEMRLLRGEIDTLRADLAARQSAPTQPSVRVEPYTVKEFATLIRRAPAYVSTRCRGRSISTLPGKPYLIPVAELTRYLTEYNTPTAPRKNAR